MLQDDSDQGADERMMMAEVSKGREEEYGVGGNKTKDREAERSSGEPKRTLDIGLNFVTERQTNLIAGPVLRHQYDVNTQKTDIEGATLLEPNHIDLRKIERDQEIPRGAYIVGYHLLQLQEDSRNPKKPSLKEDDPWQSESQIPVTNHLFILTKKEGLTVLHLPALVVTIHLHEDRVAARIAWTEEIGVLQLLIGLLRPAELLPFDLLDPTVA